MHGAFMYMSNLKFLKTAIKDYKVGALTLSSRYVIDKVVSQIKPHYLYIVEYGAGNGIVTREILKKLPNHGRLIAVELNNDFIQELKSIHDPRLTIIHGDIKNIAHNLKKLTIPHIDMVISGVPFTFIKPAIRKEIIRDTCAALGPGGVFVIYQYTLMVLPIVKQYTKRVRTHFELRNFPPYFIMVGEK